VPQSRNILFSDENNAEDLSWDPRDLPMTWNWLRPKALLQQQKLRYGSIEVISDQTDEHYVINEKPQSTFLITIILGIILIMSTVLICHSRASEDIAISLYISHLSQPRAETNEASLLLLRHAKSSWENPHLNDFDRPLAKHGRNDAIRLGELLVQEHVPAPDLILSSSSVRTCQTLHLIQKSGWAQHVPVEYTEEWYTLLNDDKDNVYLEHLREALAGRSTRRVMLVGHNMAMEELFHSLVEDHRKFNPGALADIRWRNFHNWTELGQTKATLVHFWDPKKG